MTQNTNDSEAENLYRIIRGELVENSAALTSDDEEFAASLHRNAQNIQADPFFHAALETRLRKITPASPKPAHQFFSGIGKNLAWIAAAAAIIAIVSWSIRSLLPQPPVAATAPVEISITQTPTSTPAPETAQADGTPSAVATPLPNEYLSPMLPDNKLIMLAEFPVSPNEAKIFIQNFDEPLTVENARLMAQQLGINGNVYMAPGELEQVQSYYVSDGVSRVFFFSPHHYYYVPNYFNSLKVEIHKTPTTDEQIAAAETFLKDHGLLDFPYQIATNDSVPGSVQFRQLLDGKLINYSAVDYAVITVQFDSHNELWSVDYHRLFFAESGTYPIVSAEEAWQKALASDLPNGIEVGSQFRYPNENEMWSREYPRGQRVELFGYVEILKPAEPGVPSLIFMNNYPLKGNLQELEQGATPGIFMHMWGQFSAGEKENPFFEVEGWQPSTFPDKTLQGLIQRDGDQGYLNVDGTQWLIPDMPADISDGLEVYVRGVIFENEASLEWSSISTSMGGGGGGGGGGSGFTALNLNKEPTPVPQPTETPFPVPQIGERFDGIQGNPYVTLFQNTDGSTKTTAYLHIQPSNEWPGGLSLNLTGEGLSGIEAYHQIPIKIWGSVSDFDQSSPVVNVERYEPVYPGVKAQAWLGTLEQVTLSGKTVLQFTDQTGNRFILNTSLESEHKVPQIEIPYVIEGVIYPDQTYEGIPVIHDFSMFGAQGLENLDDYKPKSINPMTLEGRMMQEGEGTITIDRVELAYYTEDLRYGNPVDPGLIIYAQPVWRFFGHYEDGNEFEILIQALTEEYLQ